MCLIPFREVRMNKYKAEIDKILGTIPVDYKIVKAGWAKELEKEILALIEKARDEDLEFIKGAWPDVDESKE